MGKEVEELVKRLRRRASDRRVGVPNVDLRFKPTTTLLIEAADTIESLRASLARVEEERDETSAHD